MNCFECAKASDSVPAVGVCGHCGVGLCLDHLLEAADYRVGGTTYACESRDPAHEAVTRCPGRDCRDGVGITLPEWHDRRRADRRDQRAA